MMMMTMIKKWVQLLILIFVPLSAFSQEKDFGIWYGVNGEIPIINKLDVELSAVVRTFNNASKIEQAYIEGGANYKFNKFLSIVGSYRFTENLENNSEYHVRNKWFADAKISLPLNRLVLSARFRFEVQTRSYIVSTKDLIPDYHGRLKLKALYKIPKFPVNPYLSYESFSPMYVNSDRFIDKERFTLGFEYKISKKQAIEAEYIYQRDFVSDIQIISINYFFSFFK